MQIRLNYRFPIIINKLVVKMQFFNSSCSSQFESLFHPKLTKNVKNGLLTLFSMWKLVVKSKSAQRPLGVSYDKKMSKYKILRRNFDGS